MDSLYLLIFTRIASVEGFIIAAVLIAVYLFIRHTKRQAYAFLFAAIGLMISTQALKNLFHIPRPLDALIETAGYAFPSGHAAGSLFLALCISYLVRKKSNGVRYAVWTVCAIAVILIGQSRIELGVHTPLQVSAGYGIGTFWVLVCIAVSQSLTHRAIKGI